MCGPAGDGARLHWEGGGFNLSGKRDRECGLVPFCTTPFIYWYVKHWSFVASSSEPPLSSPQHLDPAWGAQLGLLLSNGWAARGECVALHCPSAPRHPFPDGHIFPRAASPALCLVCTDTE